MISAELQDLILQFTDAEDDLLKHIDRETQTKVLMPRMISGHYQGRVLSMLSKLMRPHRILEIGTFTGYATLCLAEGLSSEGKIYTIDKNAELEDRVREFFAASIHASKIEYLIGDAQTQIATLKHEQFDILFIDADKKNNGTYYDLLFDQVKPGGLIIVDNVLWSGKVLNQIQDTDTKNITSFNEKIKNDNRVEKLILPVRDGLFMIRKKE